MHYRHFNEQIVKIGFNEPVVMLTTGNNKGARSLEPEIRKKILSTLIKN